LGLDRFLGQRELVCDLRVVVWAFLRDDIAVQQPDDAPLSRVQV
jgi:hypothetical protein